MKFIFQCRLEESVNICVQYLPFYLNEKNTTEYFIEIFFIYLLTVSVLQCDLNPDRKVIDLVILFKSKWTGTISELLIFNQM